ncbi:hypothetical protein FEM48_Zijuj07G0118900 [Ziziphus jujuba var. spinosa]|uniref:F-box domain-containing protein n=1 Tax=Ziziphus jujuba var. spinosa TaxID=714518 RepID=A0A978V4H0_ZIZJJ|nr:hypothetical protein FEM48_Zijuj07G0118900 [Ziziphus jujuba var. spinosa]
MTCQNERPNWLELHSDLLEFIFKKLVLPYIVRFKSVCSLWKTVVESYMASPIYAPLLRPLLMLHNSQQQQQEFEADSSSSLFYSLAEKKVYKLSNLFGVFGKNTWCIGSTRGWLVILDARLNLHLLNPISRARIQLAMTPQYRNHHLYINPYTHPEFPKFYIHKAVLLFDPSHGKNFILVVMFTMEKILLFVSSKTTNGNTLAIRKITMIYLATAMVNCMLYLKAKH